jgi:hypothetical protein
MFGVAIIGCHGIQVCVLHAAFVLLNCEKLCVNGGACWVVPDRSVAEKISESWRSA